MSAYIIKPIRFLTLFRYFVVSVNGQNTYSHEQCTYLSSQNLKPCKISTLGKAMDIYFYPGIMFPGLVFDLHVEKLIIY